MFFTYLYTYGKQNLADEICFDSDWEDSFSSDNDSESDNAKADADNAPEQIFLNIFLPRTDSLKVVVITDDTLSEVG